MKNKTIQRILSFTLALILCFSIAVKPIEAKALAVESWLIYAIITYMAAVGFTFTAAGGANALMSAVEDRWGEFQEHKKGEGIIIDIAPYIQYKPPTPSPGGNGFDIGPKFWYGVAAAAAIKDFIEWLVNIDSSGDDDIIENYETVTYLRWVYNGVDGDFVCPVLGQSTTTTNKITSYELLNDPTFISKSDMGSAGSSFDGAYYLYGFDNRTDSYIKRTAAINSSLSFRWYSNDGSYSTSSSVASVFNSLGVTYGDDFYITFLPNTNSSGIYGSIEYFLYVPNVSSRLYFLGSTSITWLEWDAFENSSGYSIDYSGKIEDFEIDEDHLVEISFDAFSDNVTYETPEEFAEAIEQKIADTGTVPDITTQVVTLPEPAPTPVIPLPEAPPVYDDVENLGLPQFGAVLMEKFPFCLVSDFGRVVKVFTAERQTPKWEVDLFEPLHGRIEMQGDTMLSIDLTEYEQLGQISRWITTLGFCLMLIFITKQMISW